jgi:aryl-alcohol dehydrogenase-like predicted oxidoreductase
MHAMGDNLENKRAQIYHLKTFPVSLSKGHASDQVALALLYAQAKAMGTAMVAISATPSVNFLERRFAALQVQLSDEE